MSSQDDRTEPKGETVFAQQLAIVDQLISEATRNGESPMSLRSLNERLPNMLPPGRIGLLVDALETLGLIREVKGGYEYVDVSREGPINVERAILLMLLDDLLLHQVGTEMFAPRSQLLAHPFSAYVIDALEQAATHVEWDNGGYWNDNPPAWMSARTPTQDILREARNDPSHLPTWNGRPYIDIDSIIAEDLGAKQAFENYARALDAASQILPKPRAWMIDKNPFLGGKTPQEVCQSNDGLQEVLDLLKRIRYGFGV